MVIKDFSLISENSARKSTKALNNREKMLKKQVFFQNSSPKAPNRDSAKRDGLSP
jgi:hypothetical protein